MRRRTFLGLGAGLLPLGFPLRELAAAPDSEQLFIFVFCNGGWDQTKVFAPVFDGNFEPEVGASLATVGGLDFVDSPLRPAVRTFFEDFGDRACLLNGFEVQSISHVGCTRRVFTANQGEDWGSRIAASASGLLMPHVLVSGPGFTDELTAQLVRIGETGQLGPLLNGSALEASDLATTGLDPAAAAQVDAYVLARAQEQGGDYGERLDDLSWLLERAQDLSISGDKLAPLVERLLLPLDAFEQGLSRVATVEFLGLNDMGWDQHSDLAVQDIHFELLFQQLHDLLLDLDARGLGERTTLVVFSEMGRNPVGNANGGKDHWTFTSAMFLGAGIAGGQSLGGWDADCVGLPIDPVTGSLGELRMRSEDFGATVLALGGLEAAKGRVIRALLA